MDTEGRLTLRKRIYRRGTPAGEIKITVLLRGFAGTLGGTFGGTPRILPIVTIFCAVGGALPLGFGGQQLPCPARIRFRLRLTHINRPTHGQRDLGKHGAIQPLTILTPLILTSPESWMRNFVAGPPVPIL